MWICSLMHLSADALIQLGRPNLESFFKCRLSASPSAIVFALHHQPPEKFCVKKKKKKKLVLRTKYVTLVCIKFIIIDIHIFLSFATIVCPVLWRTWWCVQPVNECTLHKSLKSRAATSDNFVCWLVFRLATTIACVFTTYFGLLFRLTC